MRLRFHKIRASRLGNWKLADWHRPTFWWDNHPVDGWIAAISVGRYVLTLWGEA